MKLDIVNVVNIKKPLYLRNKSDAVDVDKQPTSDQGNSCKELLHEINTTRKIRRYSWL